MLDPIYRVTPPRQPGDELPRSYRLYLDAEKMRLFVISPSEGLTAHAVAALLLDLRAVAEAMPLLPMPPQ